MYGNSVSGGLGAKRASPFMAPQQQPEPEYVEEMVEVVTEPAGARIHINDALAGHSPLQYTVRRFWRGQPGYMALDTIKVEALPTAGGQCVQSGTYGQNNQKAPAPLRFVMTDCKAQGYTPTSK
ncbi:MAG: hypothetical protein A2X32_05710 [Elusimicrobia bacterium GWC2_64_44]|nr:MAG: hypothetical protein A2X32_05710 [Elusimicrobia bacterium GWC2_64_44]